MCPPSIMRTFILNHHLNPVITCSSLKCQAFYFFILSLNADGKLICGVTSICSGKHLCCANEGSAAGYSLKSDCFVILSLSLRKWSHREWLNLLRMQLSQRQNAHKSEQISIILISEPFTGLVISVKPWGLPWPTAVGPRCPDLHAVIFTYIF